MPTLGDTNAEPSNNSPGVPNLHVSGPYTATQNGTISSLSVMMYGGPTSTTHYKLVCYEDTGSGYPGALVAESAEFTFTSPDSGTWHTHSVSGSIISGHSYWIGVIAGRSGEAPDLNYKYTGTPAGGTKIVYDNDGLFPSDSAAPNPYPAGKSNIGWQMSAYLTYTLSPPSNSVAPAVTGTPIVGNTLTSDTGTWADDGSPTFSYQWQRDNSGGGVYSDIVGQTTNSHLLVSADAGCHVRCRVTDTDSGGSTTASSNAVTVSSGGAPLNLTPPTIAGTPTVGHILRATKGVWADDGSPTISYQWQRDNSGGGTFSNISLATGNTYTLVSADNGCQVRCNITETDSGGTTTQASDTVAVAASASITWSPTSRQAWEPDTIMLFDPDQEKQFRSDATQGFVDASGQSTSSAACVPWRSGAPYNIVAGKFRRGMQGASGSEQWIWIPGAVIPAKTFTIEFWVKNSAAWSTIGNQIGLVTVGATQDDFSQVASHICFHNSIGDGGKPAVGIHTPGTAAFKIVSTGAVPGANTWVHLAITYDGSTITFFVDGTSVGTHSLVAPKIWTGQDRDMGGLALLEHSVAGLGGGTDWQISDLRISRVPRVPSSAVTVVGASSVAFSNVETGVQTNKYLRGGVHHYGNNAAVLNTADFIGITLARVSKIDSGVPAKAGGTDATHPTLGHSGSYSFDFRALDRLCNYLLAHKLDMYLNFGSVPSVLGGSVSPLTSTQSADPNQIGFEDQAWAPDVPTTTAAMGTFCADIYYYIINTYPTLPIPYMSYANEPDGGSSQWNGTTTQMFDTYKAVVNAIRAINPAQKVGGLEIADYWNQSTTWVQNFISYCGANSVPLDYISYHSYQGDIGIVDKVINNIAAWSATAGITAPKIIIGELGWSGFHLPNLGAGFLGAPWAESNFWINDWGAAFLAASLLIFQEAGVEAAAYYQLIPNTASAAGYDGTILVDSVTGLPWAAGNVERLFSLVG